MEIYELATPAAIETATGLSQHTVKSILRRDSIGPKAAMQLSKTLGISFRWIRYGEGVIEKPGSEIEGYIGHPSEEVAEKIRPPIATDLPLNFILIAKAKATLGAGGGVIPEEGNREEAYAFRREWLKKIGCTVNRVILVDVEGDSMAPTLFDGDTVLIDLNRADLREGRIYAIAVGDVVQIKRLQRLAGDRIRVISDNSAYHSYEVSAHDIRIIGQMVWFGRTAV